MSPSPSDLLEGLAATVASIEDADNAIDELDVTLTGSAPDGQVRVTVPLFGDDIPEESQVTLTSAGIDGSDLVVDLEIEVDDDRELPAVEAEQLEAASTAEDRSADATTATADDTVERADSESAADADEEIQTEGSATDTEAEIQTEDSAADADERTQTEDSAADVEEDTKTEGSNPSEEVEGTTAESTARPAYRDPDRLAAVYDPEATFAEMTEELGVDVTAQTVRKYMIEHGIHNPAPRQSESGADAAGSESEAESSSEAQSDPSDGVGESEKPNRTEPEEIDEADVDKPTQSDGPDTDQNEAPTETDESRTSREIVPPTRLPDGVTIERLVEVLTRSRTVYEVQRGLDLDGKQTRSLLHRLNLIDLVTGRINKGDTPPTEEEVLNRLADGDRGPDRAEV